ncbi:UNVERIFIED_CONTAM: U3 small nucleolar RNA-associated protein 18 [Sesamum latifolium]|uniref:U3 small nucleolar RNA-associated protein 18 n=1 Tax=Sesamum latifolium TaxID=2727402 RepID=A0AAW2XVW9_9LAMI
MKKNSMKLIHVPSLTVFTNWPPANQTLHHPMCMDFSPRGGFMALGDAGGRVSLYKLHHYHQAYPNGSPVPSVLILSSTRAIAAGLDTAVAQAAAASEAPILELLTHRLPAFLRSTSLFQRSSTSMATLTPKRWRFLPITDEGRTADAFRRTGARAIDEGEVQAEMVAAIFYVDQKCLQE